MAGVENIFNDDSMKEIKADLTPERRDRMNEIEKEVNALFPKKNNINDIDFADFVALPKNQREKFEKLMKEAGNIMLDPDGNGKFDEKHAKLLADSLDTSLPDVMKALKEAMRGIESKGNSKFGDHFINHNEKNDFSRNIAEAFTDFAGMIGVKTPNESANIVSDAIARPIKIVAMANNEAFFDRGDVNHGNVGRGDGKLTTEEMQQAIKRIHESGQEITEKELRKATVDLNPSETLIKAGLAYQEYLRGKEPTHPTTNIEQDGIQVPNQVPHNKQNNVGRNS